MQGSNEGHLKMLLSAVSAMLMPWDIPSTEKQITCKLIWNKDCLVVCSLSSTPNMVKTFDRCEQVRQGVTLEPSCKVYRYDRAEIKHETVNSLENTHPSKILHTFKDASWCHHMKPKQVVVKICGNCYSSTHAKSTVHRAYNVHIQYMTNFFSSGGDHKIVWTTEQP